MAGSEVRVFQAGTTRLMAAALVDSGSGYCSQNAMPVHLGVPATWRGDVDVEVTTIGRGQRRATVLHNIAPADHRRKPLRVRAR